MSLITWDGAPAVLPVLLDVTDRRRGEETLRKLSSAVEQSPRMIVFTDLKGIVEYVNSRSTTVTGYRPEEVVGRPLTIPPLADEPPEAVQEFWYKLSAGRTFHDQWVSPTRDGSS